MEHPKDKDIKLCSNKAAEVINGHILRGHIFI